MKKFIVLVIFGVMISCWSASPKLISVGFASPSPSLIKNNLPEIEKYFPGCGVALHIDQPAPGGKHAWAYRHTIFHRNWKWQKEWFNQVLADLQTIKAKAQKLKHNFLYAATTGHDYDMFDDAAWNCVLNNIGIWAELAQKGGLEGLFFDIEFYNKDGKPGMFQYNPASGRSFKECELKARQRGREFMRAIVAKFPTVKIILPLGFSINYPTLSSGQITNALETERYGLSPAFYNGMIDVMTPESRIYDGVELAGYIAKGALDYYRIVSQYYNWTPKLIAPENRHKFVAQTAPAIPIYLDCYVNEKGFWVVKSDIIPRMQLFRRNLHYALQNTGEYVWMYYDAVAKFAPQKLSPYYENYLKRVGKGQARQWSDVLPGFYEAIAAAQDPYAYAHKQLAQGKAEKVFADDFESGKNNLLLWSSRNRGKMHITAAGYKSTKALQFDNVAFGSADRKIPARPGELFYFRAVSRRQGEIATRLSVRWTYKGQTVNHLIVRETPFGRDLGHGWYAAELAVFVPDNVDHIHPTLAVRSESGQNIVAIFDNFEVYRIK